MKFVMECGSCDGDLSYAKDLVDTLAEFPGVAMKVQFYTAETLASHTSPRYDHTDSRPLTQRQLFKKVLTWDEWALVAEYAKSKSVEFFPSVFSPQAVDKAVEMGLATLKIASGDITHRGLIEYAAYAVGTRVLLGNPVPTGNPATNSLVISTGAANEVEVRSAIAWILSVMRYPNNNLTVLACHLAYPSNEAQLRRVEALYDLVSGWETEGTTINVGYSDHTHGITTVPLLTTLGVSMWEKHFTIRPKTGGDHNFAIDPSYLANAIHVHQQAERLLGSGTLTPTPSEFAARIGARRSLAAAVDIDRGNLLTHENTTWLRPATGISFADARQILGHAIATRDIYAGATITADMVTSGY
jgi:sialic acid synthase SpsE